MKKKIEKRNVQNVMDLPYKPIGGKKKYMALYVR